MIPPDIEHLMLEAWESILPRLKDDPDELHLRLARRRSALFQKPFRPYCLALKANDLRISPYRAIFTPEHAIRLDDPRHPYEYIEHTVRLTSELLRFLCRPFHLLPPGEPASDVAIKLGCSYTMINAQMRRGVFLINPKKGLRGRRGHPVPVLYAHRWFDPMSDRNFEFPDPVWGTTPDLGPLWKRIPDGIEQTLTRRPAYGAYRKPTHFNGWRWVCPGCARLTKLIFRPLPPPMLDLQSDFPPHIRRAILDCDERERGLQCFACETCHQVRRRARVDAHALWNVLISLFSGGLLYGREVDRPPRFAAQAARKHTYRAKPRPCRSTTHAEVLQLLTDTDLSLNRIAIKLDIHRAAVQGHAKRAYRDHHVSNRHELRQALARQSAQQYPAQRKTA